MDAQLPSKEEIAKSMKDAQARDAYWHEHMQEFRRDYPRLFVAVRDGHVIKTAPHLAELLEAFECEDISQREVWVKYIATEDERFVPSAFPL